MGRELRAIHFAPRRMAVILRQAGHTVRLGAGVRCSPTQTVPLAESRGGQGE